MKIPKYEAKKIEKKWQKIWAKDASLKVKESASLKKKKEYVLNMFPYPSALGLHVGHVLGWTCSDILARYFRMRGKHVLYPAGFDAFGLPAENYAIKTKIHPAKTTKKAIANFTKQWKSLGISPDWSRIISTSEPDYYKWTQWLFLEFYKKGLAYKKKAPVNWCGSCQTVLAREQVVGGKCERCKNEVVQKELDQWFFKITEYADRLLDDLKDLDWPHSIKEAQKNWIGKSEGFLLSFELTIGSVIEVFTTRPDTLCGATYLVLAPEHPSLVELKTKISNWVEVFKYAQNSQKKSELERTELSKAKTGVRLEGVSAINPGTSEKIPVFVADYVVMSYGTGAIMAVPCHDERDLEFAHIFDLPVRQVVRKIDAPIRSYLMGGEEISDDELRAVGIEINEVLENGDRKITIPRRAVSQYEELINSKMTPGFWNEYIGDDIVFIFKHPTGRIERIVLTPQTNDHIDKLAAEFSANSDLSTRGKEHTQKNENVWKWLAKNSWYKELITHSDQGILINSLEWTGLNSLEAKKNITRAVSGRPKLQYHLRDWLISRQRYWGTPIPIIYCNACGMVPVSDKDLPVKLPTDVDFLPHGESPLTKSKSFHSVKCPKCGAKDGVRREVDTMDTFVDSSWYFLRYADPKNAREYASKEKVHYWSPVDWYIGGAEHAVLHLLYARFFTKVLFDLRRLKFQEPFKRLRTHGMILGEDNQKMSKSIGNVINPDDVINTLGADTLRMYEMFMGPFSDTKPWSSSGMMGVRRFLDRVYKMQQSIALSKKSEKTKNAIRSLLHQSIQKIGSQIETFSFNTCVSQLMILLNDFERNLPNKKEWEAFITLLYPFAPHLASECYELTGHRGGLKKAVWPKYDTKKTIPDTVFVAVQVIGKLRATLEVPKNSAQDYVEELARKNEKVQMFIEGREVVKVIYVPDRVINFVVK